MPTPPSVQEHYFGKLALKLHVFVVMQFVYTKIHSYCVQFDGFFDSPVYSHSH